jgi:hypothetical protein
LLNAATEELAHQPADFPVMCFEREVPGIE